MAEAAERSEIPCPRCGVGRPHRWGREHERQRFRCRGCLRTFTETTGTTAARLRHRSRWHRYIDARRDGQGVRSTARTCRVAASTVLRWWDRIDLAKVDAAPPPIAGVVSMYSGIGALDLGFERAGFTTVMSNELRPAFAVGYQHARAAVGVPPPRHGLVLDTAAAFLDERKDQLTAAMTEARATYGLVAFLGGPPCPDFSVAGKQGGSQGKHGRLTTVYADLIVTHQPDFFVFENVGGLWSTATHRQFYDSIRDRLDTSGYALTDRLVNALHFGVPQDRRRIILIGFRRGTFSDADAMAAAFCWSAYATHEDGDTAPWPSTAPFAEDGRRCWPRQLPTRYRPLTVQYWFANNRVEDHPNGRDGFVPRAGLPRMLTIPEGDTVGKSLKRLHRWRYSPTACYGNNEVHLHPWQARRISVAEAMALQSMPKEFSLPHGMSLTDKFKSVGNAVPYRLALGIAKSLADCLKKGEKSRPIPGRKPEAAVAPETR